MTEKIGKYPEKKKGKGEKRGFDMSDIVSNPSVEERGPEGYDKKKEEPSPDTKPLDISDLPLRVLPADVPVPTPTSKAPEALQTLYIDDLNGKVKEYEERTSVIANLNRERRILLQEIAGPTPRSDANDLIQKLNIDLQKANADAEASFSTYLAVLKRYPEATPEEKERMLPTLKKNRDALIQRSEGMTHVPVYIKREINALNTVLFEADVAGPYELLAERPQKQSMPPAATLTTPTDTPVMYEPYPQELRTPKADLLFTHRPDKSITYTTPFSEEDAIEPTTLPDRPEHLRDEPSTRTVEDFARDVESLEQKFKVATQKKISPVQIPRETLSDVIKIQTKSTTEPLHDEAKLHDVDDVDMQHAALQKSLREQNKRANLNYRRDTDVASAGIPTGASEEKIIEPTPAPESEPVSVAQPEIVPQPVVQPEEIPVTPPEAAPTTERYPTHPLARDVAEKFESNFSLDAAALAETPGFTNLTETQQRLVLERFSSLVRENIHTKAVKGHLEKIDTIGRTHAPSRYGKLKRAVRRGWHTATRSYQIGTHEEELHAAWQNTEGGKELEKLRLLSEISQSVREEDSFGVDKKGRINFSDGQEELRGASELLNTLIRTKPEIGEKGAQERLTALNETIQRGIDSIRSSFPETMEAEHEKAFEKLAADWALRARREVVLGTFMEKHRDLEKSLQGSEAARGLISTTLVERGGLAMTGFVGRGVLGTLCGVLALPLVGAGIGGFMGWRRKGIEQDDNNLLARMGEKLPTSNTSSQKPAVSTEYLTTLRNGVEERLTAAKNKKGASEEIRVLSQRLADYDAQLQARTNSRRETPSVDSFGFDNGTVLNEKLLRLAKEYAHAKEELHALHTTHADQDLLEAQLIKTEKLADRLAARTDYTQKRLMQQRVAVGTTPSTRARMLSELAIALGTAATTLSLHDKNQQVTMRAHLNDVSAVLAQRDTKIDAKRLSERKRAALEGAAIGAGFAFAGAALRDILTSDSAIAARYRELNPPSQKTPLAVEKDTVAMDALMNKLSPSGSVAKPLVPETVIGGSGGFQATPQEWRGEPVPPSAPSEFTKRLHAMEEALRQKPVPRPQSYDIPRFSADYHSPQQPRHFPEAWARGTAVLNDNDRMPERSFFGPTQTPNPATLEALTTIAHETPADAQRVMSFYQHAVEGKSAGFAQHIREEYSLKARVALKYPALTADIARMDPPLDDATMQSLIKMTKGAYLNGKSNPFMYAQSGVTDVPKYPEVLPYAANGLDRMRVVFARDASGKVISYKVVRQ